MEPIISTTAHCAAKGGPRSRFAIALRYLAYPTLMGSVLLFSLHAWHPGREAMLTSALFLCVMAAAVLLERRYPFALGWNLAWRNSKQDAAFFLLAQPAVAVAELAATVTGLAAALRLAELTEPLAGWSVLPLACQLVLALLLSELPLYVLHRASHRSSGLLWRLHAIHHMPERVYTLNFARFHPLNVFFNALATLLPLVALGTPPQVIFLVAVLQKTHGVLTHTNFDFRLGPLNWIFSMAELHRWHHVRDLRHADGNFGGMLIVWDVLFKTRKRPALSVAEQPLGIAQVEQQPNGVWDQVSAAFGSKRHG